FINILLREYKDYFKIYINNIVITSDLVKDYIKYLNTIFILFILKNIVLSLKKFYFGYPNVELLDFYINNFGLLIIKEYIQTFTNLAFLNNFKVLE
ncbi:uncharacterized protein B0T23DRAFT_327432, partial [Neurospora hispaniola]